MPEKKLPPVHPGEVLREEFLGPMNITQYRLARSIDVPARRINEIVHEKRAISADTALRLARFFGTSPEFWLNLQAHYDLETHRARLGPRLAELVSYSAVVSRSRQETTPAKREIAYSPSRPAALQGTRKERTLSSGRKTMKRR